MYSDIPRFFQDISPLYAALPIWQRKLMPVFNYLRGATLQKFVASDEGLLTLGVYKPGGPRDLVIASIQKGKTGLFISNEKPSNQPKPNGFVQITRKYLLGRFITQTWFSLSPLAAVLEFKELSPNQENHEEINAGPDTLILDFDARPPRICLAKKLKEVPERYNHVAGAFRESNFCLFESFCEWSLDTTKTKRRVTFEHPLVGFCFIGKIDQEHPIIPHQKLTYSLQEKLQSQSFHKGSEVSLKQKIATAMNFLPPHIRRVVKTRLQFLERRLQKQKDDFPSDTEISRLEKRAKGLQANIYMWPQNSIIWYVPANLIEEFMLPAFIKLKQGQKPGNLIEDAFHELERMQRRQQELSVRLKQSEQAILEFQDLIMRSCEHIENQMKTSFPDAAFGPAKIDKLLYTLLQKNQSEDTLRLCHICDVSWIKPSQKKALQEKNEQKLPYRSFVSFTGEYIRVSRSAQDSDAMLKLMPTNHYWLHTLTGEGSHVWLEKPKRAKPSPRALRDAAILALHFSKQTKAHSGEVRVATRADIERKKNLPIGKVLVHKCETIVCRYTEEELQRILASQNERNSQ